MIYIAGQGHSGSTLLDLLMSTGGRAVSLGQISKVLSLTGERVIKGPCSCGVKAADCAFWSGILPALESNGDKLSVEDKYRMVFDQVDKLYGTDMHVVDSSKYLYRLKEIEAFADFEIFPVQLIKDVRAFTISMIDKMTRRGEKAPVLTPEKLFWGWYRNNRAIGGHLAASDKYDAFRVSYEELVFQTPTIVSDINHYLGGQYVDLEGTFNSHVISGNRMKNKIGSPADIRYDFRWLARSEWLRPYVLMPFVRSYNQQVYKILNEKNFDKLNLLYRG